MTGEKRLPSWPEFQQELTQRALKEEAFRDALLRNPKAVLESELAKSVEGMTLPPELEVKVIEQPANAIYIVLPNASTAGEMTKAEKPLGACGSNMHLFINCQGQTL